MVKEKFDLLADDPESRPVAKTPFPENNTVYEYFPHSQTNKWEPWTKKDTVFAALQSRSGFGNDS